MTLKIAFRTQREDVYEVESDLSAGEIVELLRREEAVVDGDTIYRDGRAIARVVGTRVGTTFDMWNIVPRNVAPKMPRAEA